MADAESKPESAPVWIELLAADPARAAAFYGGVLGATIEDPDPAHGDFRVMLHEDRWFGQIVPAAPGDETGWLVYLLASDVDEAVRDASAVGGEVLTPVSEVGKQGRWAVLRDPSGARVALWEPWGFPGTQVEGVPGTAGWYELHATSGYREAVRFYEEGLDWAVSVMSDTDEFRMVTYGRGDTAVAGIYDGSITEAGRPSAWQVYFVVEDAESTAGAIRDLGGTVLDGPSPTPFGLMGHALDPEGAPFAFFVPPQG